jgi:G3E family GTPase
MNNKRSRGAGAVMAGQLMTGQGAGLPAAGSAGELVEVCARQADALAAQVEAAQRVVATQLGELDRGQLDEVAASGCWLSATLRVVAASLGELHTVLDEAAHLVEDQAPGGVRVPRPRQPANQREGEKS